MSGSASDALYQADFKELPRNPEKDMGLRAPGLLGCSQRNVCLKDREASQLPTQPCSMASLPDSCTSTVQEQPVSRMVKLSQRFSQILL